MTGYLRRCWEQRSLRPRPLTARQVHVLFEAMRDDPDDEHANLLTKAMPIDCRVCGKPAVFELTPAVDDPRREYLCDVDLGPFVHIFTDRKILTWNVTRLP